MVDISRATSGVNLPVQVASEIWGATTQASAVMQAARQIALPGSGVSIPIVTGDAAADWVAETEEKPVARPTLDNKTMTPYTLAVIVPFANQFRRDLPALYGELVRRLPSALGKKFDETVFGADSAPGSNFDTLATAPELTVDSTGTFADLAAVLNAIAAQDAELTHWIARPSLHGLLLTATDTLGRQFFISDPINQNAVGSMFGAPVLRTRASMVQSTTEGDDQGIAGDFANSAVWGSVEGVQVSISDQATLNDGGTSLNLWQRNMFAVRAEIEVGFRVRDVNHFVRIQDATVDTP